MNENLIRMIGPETELRERAHEAWNHIREALFVAAQSTLAKDPFALEIVDSETKVEIASICKPVCITVTFNPRTPRLEIAGCHRPIVLNFKAPVEGLPGLERMGGVPVSVSAFVQFITQAVLSQPVKYEAST
jgi:hypothetical protein